MIKAASDANVFTEGKSGPRLEDRRVCGDHSHTGETVYTVHVWLSQQYFESCLKLAVSAGLLIFTCRQWRRC